MFWPPQLAAQGHVSLLQVLPLGQREAGAGRPGGQAQWQPWLRCLGRVLAGTRADHAPELVGHVRSSAASFLPGGAAARQEQQ
eukprot:9846415-Alexandrium_andersonii.AAC.1